MSSFSRKKISPLYKPAGALVVLSGLLHIFSFLVAGFTPDAMQFVVIGIIWAVIGFGLMRKMTWLTCIAYLAMLFGFIAALTNFAGLAIPDYWLKIIAGVDLLAAICLFGIIWSKK